MSRLKGVGHLSAADGIALGVTGPPLRASGVDFDLRRDMPYSSYDKFQFKVPISNDCDVWARYVVRLEEMRESVKICQQALDGMPEGPIKADSPKVVLPDREKMKTEMEALIYHFKIVTEGFTVPAGEVYQAIESPRGEMGYYVVSDGTAKALPRAHAESVVRHLAGAADDVRRKADRRRGRGDWVDRYRAGGDRSVSRSHSAKSDVRTELWCSFASMLKSYAAAASVHGITHGVLVLSEDSMHVAAERKDAQGQLRPHSGPRLLVAARRNGPAPVCRTA